MDPQIRYARTTDGVSIACYAIGAGQPLLCAALPFSHLQAELSDLSAVRAYEAIARVATLVRYDPRGFGLSDRDVTSFTLDELVADIEAVADRFELESFVFLALGASSPAALQYVSKHSHHVSHLILFPGFVRIEGAAWKRWEALAESATTDWDYVSEALPRAAFGFDDENGMGGNAELLRASVTPETLVRYLSDARRWDAGTCVPNLRVPTLLIQQDDASYTTMDAARRLASELPDGRVVILKGTTSQERQAETFSAAAAFIRGRTAVEAAEQFPGYASHSDDGASTTGAPTGTSIILFTDIADSTGLTERMGDAAFRDASRALDASIRAAIRKAGGSAVEGKVLGDGVMGVFSSAAAAIEAARRCASVGAESKLALHIGLHAGDVIREDDNVYGGAVNIASRICAICEPGEILVSQTVRDLARTSAGVRFDDRGEHALKGIADPVRLFAVLTAPPTV
ncbi:MAG TPA: adenylate/guanylate cyclase domain-containing protein [Dehalococcoidia bacterium]|nr:adenylate/guanylate cyclase domain-containing protein [Dehalococcoidia bacterium]